MHKQKKNPSEFSTCKGRARPAFTLVELIVVITILAILGTISFISLQGYSTDARDSTRISDLSTIRSSLELYQLDSGKYPLPTNGVSVTYSGSVVWKQGTFGETVYANLAKLDKIPKDALTDKEYTYSVINKQNEYELAGLLEGDTISLNPSQPSLKLGKEQNKANAGTVEAKAYTTGNYNGTMAKSLSGTTCSMIGVPTIIANDVTTTTDLSQIVTNKGLVYNGYKNLPSSFKESKFKHDGGFDFTTSQLIAYSDTGSCEALTATTNSGTTARVALLKGLQDTYSGTLVQSEGEIQNIVALTINTSSPSSEVIAYGANFVNNTLGGNIIINAVTSGSSSGGGSGLKSVSDCTAGGQLIYGTSDGTDTGLTCSHDIIVCSGLGTGYTIAACNLGATILYTNQTFVSDSAERDSNVDSWAGYYYQWGRNKGFTGPVTLLGSKIAGTVGLNAGSDTYGFVWDDSLPWPASWADSDISDNWGDITNTNDARKGPCPNGYHIPSISEWNGVVSAGNGVGKLWDLSGDFEGTDFMNALKLPLNGMRSQYGTIWNEGVIGHYYSSSTDWGTPMGIYFYGNFPGGNDLNTSSVGPSLQGKGIRCFKN